MLLFRLIEHFIALWGLRTEKYVCRHILWEHCSWIFPMKLLLRPSCRRHISSTSFKNRRLYAIRLFYSEQLPALKTGDCIQSDCFIRNCEPDFVHLWFGVFLSIIVEFLRCDLKSCLFVLRWPCVAEVQVLINTGRHGTWRNTSWCHDIFCLCTSCRKGNQI